MKLLLFTLFAVIVIFQSCSDSSAATMHDKNEKKIEDSSVHVLSSNLISVYNPECGCGSSGYENILAKVTIGKDTFVTIQRYSGEGGITMTKVSK